MRPRRRLWTLGILPLILMTGCRPAPLAVNVTANAPAVPAYEVFELSFQHDGKYENPFFDVAIDVLFRSPSGKPIKVGGFHYGSSTGPQIRIISADGAEKKAEYIFDRHDLWKARFAPSETGAWKYTWRFTDKEERTASGEGTFACVAGSAPKHGFLRIDPENPFRLVHDDGSPFYPVGLQDCWGDNAGNGSVLSTASMEGPFRTDKQDPLPPGSLFVRGPANNPMNAEVLLGTFARTGFNLYRFSQDNCSFRLYKDLDNYLTQEAVMADELLLTARKYGFLIMYGLFGFQPFEDRDYDGEWALPLSRFIEYSVNRWGAYVDIWELLNEQRATSRWYQIMTQTLQSADPYGHPITTSWERPELESIAINAPHWYQDENELESDSVTASKAGAWKSYGKPVIVGEQGNSTQQNGPKIPGVGGVWDPGSATRMRIRLWTSFFNEIALVFWDTSYARDGHFMNIWFGPQERQYVRALQDFSYKLGAGLKMAAVDVKPSAEVRAYGIASPTSFGAYLHHSDSHDSTLAGASITVDVPAKATGYWYSPETGRILGTVQLAQGKHTLAAPPFRVDLALLVTEGGPPDADADGAGNDADADDDNDGTVDSSDAFPLDPSEWTDADRDLIGDNFDADDDGDGKGDDADKDGTPDHLELDFDGDGVDRARVVPWDAFPFNRAEWRDTDGDGVGDNGDVDDDGDGFADAKESEAGTDPLNPLSFPL